MKTHRRTLLLKLLYNLEQHIAKVTKTNVESHSILLCLLVSGILTKECLVIVEYALISLITLQIKSNDFWPSSFVIIPICSEEMLSAEYLKRIFSIFIAYDKAFSLYISVRRKDLFQAF